MSYLIYCKERSHDGVACWWRPDSRGYTSNVLEAGRYSKEEADSISIHSRGEDFPVPEEQIGKDITTRVIVDISTADNWRALKCYELAAPRRQLTENEHQP